MILRIAFGLLSLLILVGLWRYLYSSSDTPRHPGTSYTVKTVPHSAIQDKLQRFDVTTDDEGTLHLVWQGESEGLNYQASRDQGKTWTQPVRFDVPLSFSYRRRFRNEPRVFAASGRVVVLWSDTDGERSEHRLRRRESPDGGQSWPEPSDESGLEFPASALVRYEVLADGETLYLVYTSPDGYFVSRSDDFGRQWMTPVRLAPLYENPLDPLYWAEISLAFDGERLYALLVGQDDARRSQLHLTTSQDRGERWTPPVVVDFDIEAMWGRSLQDQEGYTLEVPTLLIREDSLNLFFVNAGRIVHQVIDASGAVLKPARRVQQDASIYLSLRVQQTEEEIYLAWGDLRYQELRWWAHIDILLVLAMMGGDDSSLQNNDLMVSVMTEDKNAEGILVTPKRSYVGNLPKFVWPEPGYGLVFWSGRKKVGKTLNSYGYPTEIFFSHIL